MKYRVALITQLGEHKAENFETKEEVDSFILENNAEKFRILNKGTNKIIETDEGVRI